jgi:hypothetical protein
MPNNVRVDLIHIYTIDATHLDFRDSLHTLININLETKVLLGQLIKKLSVLLCNMMLQCRVHKLPLCDLVLNQMITANILTSCVFRTVMPEILYKTEKNTTSLLLG